MRVVERILDYQQGFIFKVMAVYVADFNSIDEAKTAKAFARLVLKRYLCFWVNRGF